MNIIKGMFGGKKQPEVKLAQPKITPLPDDLNDAVNILDDNGLDPKYIKLFKPNTVISKANLPLDVLGTEKIYAYDGKPTTKKGSNRKWDEEGNRELYQNDDGNYVTKGRDGIIAGILSDNLDTFNKYHIIFTRDILNSIHDFNPSGMSEAYALLNDYIARKKKESDTRHAQNKLGMKTSDEVNEELDKKDKEHNEEIQKIKAEENAKRNEDAARMKHKYQEQARPDAPERQEEQTQTQLNDPINNRAINSKYYNLIQDAARQRMPTDVLFDYFVDKGVPADHIKGLIQQTRTQESNDTLRKGLYEKVMMRPEILESLSGDDKAGYYTSNTKFTEPSRQNLPLPINYQDPEAHSPVPKRWLTRRMYWQVKNM